MLLLISKYNKTIAWFFACLFYFDMIFLAATMQAAPVSVAFPGKRYAAQGEWKTFFEANRMTSQVDKNVFNDKIKIPGQPAEPVKAQLEAAPLGPSGTGPGQPEMESFSSVNNDNMVDLFTGDFSYNIPLLDVGGYPVNLSYRGGISMDQEASWVGLGWNINPGTISRNLRGLPDDFNGQYDSIRKVMSIKENRTVGVTAGASAEIAGLPVGIQASTGVFKNNYKGWGLENGVNASLNSGSAASGILTSGLSITNNTQEGVTIKPSFEILTAERSNEENSGIQGTFSLALPYNSRSGLKSLQLSAGVRRYSNDIENQYASSSAFSSHISFVSPSFTPSITIPFSSRQYSFTAKTGVLKKVYDANFFLSGYVSSQRIEEADTLLALPAYGYLHFQDAKNNGSALLDHNFEKDLPYREKPPVPHIAVPSYTYDAFSITGEGTGGMFRAYRGDIGFVSDHRMRSKDQSGRGSIDFGGGDIVHAGVDLNINRAYSENGPWLENNSIQKIIGFRKDTAAFEAAYFRNPGEKAINAKAFYDAIGGDDLVTVNLFQPNSSSPLIQATNYLRRYRNKRWADNILLNPDSVYKRQRDKRSQVISFLTAKDAEVAGLSRYIDNHKTNVFNIPGCDDDLPVETGSGLVGEYYQGRNFETFIGKRTDPTIDFIEETSNWPLPSMSRDNYSIRWTGRIQAPESGEYYFEVKHDNGARFWINDSLKFNNWQDKAPATDTFTVYLMKDEFYRIRIDFYEATAISNITLKWKINGGALQTIPQANLFTPAVDTIAAQYLTREKRLNTFRKPDHISEVNVLNSDGRRYVYGIPVYNLKHHEATFSVDGLRSNEKTGLVGYSNTDNSTGNQQGNDNYYKSEDIPAYAHSFLLTGILSADYVDITGNGISDDDLGDAVKFNYTKTAGIKNPFKWRAPYVKDSVNYSKGLKTDGRDDKGNYVYGEKELWYLHSIESKTMIATFVVEGRDDLLSINDRGVKQNSGSAKRLREINLYSKADFAKKGTAARPIKTVHFAYSYQLCRGMNKDINMTQDTGKLTLERVWFTYNNNKKGQQNPYVFSYANNQPYQQKAYDRWGNYKNPVDNPGAMGNDEYPYSLQDSVKSALNAAAWALDSIYLPSGGSIKVEYESDDYAFVQHKRAMGMFAPIGFGETPGMTGGFASKLHNASGDRLYIYLSLNQPASDKEEFYRKYLEGIEKLYFRLLVKMPSDIFGSGSEYVSGYAEIEPVNGYGLSNSNIAWIKLKGISLKGDGPGDYSPLSKAAIQFLRLNLPSKAYPGSETEDQLTPDAAVKLLLASYQNILGSFSSFEREARNNSLASEIDLAKSFIRLNSPEYKKYGGGHRVKRIKIYDNWNHMSGGRKSAVYGQEYIYTAKQEINGIQTVISSGVASYEPILGGDENPFRQPIEYIDKSSILGPVNLGYSEEPLGESFFPSASVGYSKVRVRTINHQNIKSANGYEETSFYTTYDFPTYTDRTLLDRETKKRFKPSIANFLRINARHHIALSQGFKIELNDMNGKLRSKAYYAENDPDNYVSYTENIYRVEDAHARHKRLSNRAMVIDPSGKIDSAGIIGQDIELMTAMREQRSIMAGYNVNVNADMFSVPVPGFFILPSLINLYQREENIFRSAATVKVIQRYGILDSVIHIDKGSKISTKDVLYDSETGDVLLSRTQNEYNDPVYNFSYPSHWAYDAMGLAYKNINVSFDHVTIKNGRILSGLPNPEDFFSSGDEILVGGKLHTGTPGSCNIIPASFPSFSKIWAIDTSVLSQGPRTIYFIDKDGKPYDGNDITLKIIRSGRRNMLASVGAMTSLVNPVQYDNDEWKLRVDSTLEVLNASATAYKQFWKVEDRKKEIPAQAMSCDTLPAWGCGAKDTYCSSCLSNLFLYLRSSGRLFVPIGDSIPADTILANATALGYSVSSCSGYVSGSSTPFYTITSMGIGTIYRIRFGNSIFRMEAEWPVNFSHLKSIGSIGFGKARFYDSVNVVPGDTTFAEFYPESRIECSSPVSSSCASIVTDTAFNPYVTGVLGNWRVDKSYAYYSSRVQTDPAAETNIRFDGAIKSYKPFWAFVDDELKPQPDTTRWVWNSQITLFNRRGLEIENKDPLGRYNAGLYGYNQTLPTAVIQNSRYRESGFDGFEDYHFTTQVCDTACSGDKQMDFSPYIDKLDTLVSHTGKSSLRLNGDNAGLEFDLSDLQQDSVEAKLNFLTGWNCGAPGALYEVKISDDILLPSFSPVKGRRMVFSAWVKEESVCNSGSYQNNQVQILFDGSGALTFYPSGSIIEGWQRYESVFDIPENASTITVSLQAKNSEIVYFDDVRLHPYNANMKSFVFHPVNLRLMAELDENNYATFYEYDDDGTLVRLKKETQRGIKTIKETRSALLKE